MKNGAEIVDTGAEFKLQSALLQMKRKSVKIGWFESSNYPDGTPVAYVAAIQNYGSPAQNIPPRPFMENTEDAKRGEWNELLAEAAEAIINDEVGVIEALDKIGFKAEGDIAETISQIIAPPLKSATVAARLRKRANRTHVGNLTKPLIDTGLMFATLTHVVGKRDAES